jgi:hypothetical protein
MCDGFDDSEANILSLLAACAPYYFEKSLPAKGLTADIPGFPYPVGANYNDVSFSEVYRSSLFETCVFHKSNW